MGWTIKFQDENLEGVELEGAITETYLSQLAHYAGSKPCIRREKVLPGKFCLKSAPGLKTLYELMKTSKDGDKVQAGLCSIRFTYTDAYSEKGESTLEYLIADAVPISLEISPTEVRLRFEYALVPECVYWN